MIYFILGIILISSLTQVQSNPDHTSSIDNQKQLSTRPNQEPIRPESRLKSRPLLAQRDPTSPKRAQTSPKRAQTTHRWTATSATFKSCNNPILALSIIEVESNFINQKALTEDSTGLMQIRPGTAKGLDCLAKTETQLLNVDLNIECGCTYLKTLSKRYHKLEDQIAAYNAGSVKKCYTGKLYPSGKLCQIGKYINQDYVDKVMSVMETRYGYRSRKVQTRRICML